MSKTSIRLKAPALATEEEFRAALSELVQHQNKVALLCAQRDGIVQRIQARYAQRIAPFEDAIDAKLSLVEKYAEANRAALLPKDKKSVATALAIFGWRTGNRTVKPLGKKWTPDAIIAALKSMGLGGYVRTTEEIAKDLILADSVDDALPVHVDSGVVAIPLDTVGLKITQTETFYVEPKAESGETLKPAEAAA